MQTLAEHPWPGNVRELKNVVERLVVRGAERRDWPRRSTPRSAADGRACRPTGACAASDTPCGGHAVRAHGQRRRIVLVLRVCAVLSRDLTRDDLRTVVEGTGTNVGNYKVMVELFNMPPDDYKRFLGFLRKYQCHMPFQQFRSATSRDAGRTGFQLQAAWPRRPEGWVQVCPSSRSDSRPAESGAAIRSSPHSSFRSRFRVAERFSCAETAGAPPTVNTWRRSS